MPQTLSVNEMASHFADYLERVSSRRESFVLVQGSLPVAELRPLPSGLPLSSLPGLLAGLPHLEQAEADQFASDLEAARSDLSGLEPSDPWAS